MLKDASFLIRRLLEEVVSILYVRVPRAIRVVGTVYLILNSVLRALLTNYSGVIK